MLNHQVLIEPVSTPLLFLVFPVTSLAHELEQIATLNIPTISFVLNLKH